MEVVADFKVGVIGVSLVDLVGLAQTAHLVDLVFRYFCVLDESAGIVAVVFYGNGLGNAG